MHHAVDKAMLKFYLIINSSELIIVDSDNQCLVETKDITVSRDIIKETSKKDIKFDIVKHWSKKFTSCKECGRDDVPYKSNGMCKKCYSTWLSKQSRKIVYKPKKTTNDLKPPVQTFFKYECLDCGNQIELPNPLNKLIEGCHACLYGDLIQK